MRRPTTKRRPVSKEMEPNRAKRERKRKEVDMSTPTQSEGEDRDTVIGAIFALMLERKSKEYPDLRTFLEKIGMSLGSYYNLCKGVGNPTFWTLERTAKALGVSPWDLLGGEEKLMRAWLAGQNIDVDRVAQRVEQRRQARTGFSVDQFGVNPEGEKKAAIDEETLSIEPPTKAVSSAEEKVSGTIAAKPKRKTRKAPKD